MAVQTIVQRFTRQIFYLYPRLFKPVLQFGVKSQARWQQCIELQCKVYRYLEPTTVDPTAFQEHCGMVLLSTLGI